MQKEATKGYKDNLRFFYFLTFEDETFLKLQGWKADFDLDIMKIEEFC